MNLNLTDSKGTIVKAIRKIVSGRGASLLDIPIPEIGQDDLLVKVQATALCKSDVDVYEWTPTVASANYPLPITMGHEYLGEVVDIGGCVKGFKNGDHVAGETHVPCGLCHVCRIGHPHLCLNMGVLGRSFDGSFAEYVRLPQVSAIKMNSSLPASHGAIMEPLATAVHAAMKANVSGKKVAVLGCGTIGQMAVEVSRLLGAVGVIAVGRGKEKLDVAQEHGADLVVNNREQDVVQAVMDYTHGLGVEAVIETTGDQILIDQSIDILQTAGTCVFVGMVDHPLSIEHFTRRVMFKELILTGIFGRRIYETWETLAAILETGKIDLARYVGAEIPLDDFQQGLDMFKQTFGRVIMYPQASKEP